MNRRAYLALLPSIATAGCLSEFDARARLGDVLFVNETDESREVRLRVERDGETIFEETKAIPGDERDAMPGGWSGVRGELVVTVVSEGVSDSLELTEDACHSLIIELHEEYIAFFTGHDPPACETTTA